MEITVQVEPAGGAPAPVEYRWDTDTAILTAHLADPGNGPGCPGSVELAGNDGSWLILDVSGGRVRGVEIAVWPDVRKQPVLRPPAEIEAARITVPPRRSQPGVAVLQMDTALVGRGEPGREHLPLPARRPPRRAHACASRATCCVDLDEHDVLAASGS